MKRNIDYYSDLIGNTSKPSIQEFFKKQLYNNLLLFFETFGFIACAAVQMITSATSYTNFINGIVTPVQTMISILLTVTHRKTGFYIATILNVVLGIAAAAQFFVFNKSFAAPGIVATICSLITINFLTCIDGKQQKAMNTFVTQRAELVHIANDAKNAYEEIAELKTELLDVQNLLERKAYECDILTRKLEEHEPMS